MKLALLGATATVLALAAPAAANMAAPPPPSRLGSLEPAGPTPLEVQAADLVIDCSADPAACKLRVTYRVHNTSSVASSGVAAFYALDTEDLAVTVDGQPADRELSPLDIEAYDAAVAGAARDVVETATDSLGGAVAVGSELAERARDPRALVEGLTLHGVALDLAPGATAEVVVTGTILPRDRRRYYLSLPAAPARHRLYVRGGKADRRVRLHYLVSPIRTWSGFPAQMTFTLVHPRGWEASTAGVTTGAREGGAATTVHGTIATSETTIEVELAATPRAPIHAGLLVGVGGHVDDSEGVRYRIGVEAGRGAYLASLVAEIGRTDPTGVFIVPAVEMASPWAIVIPSIGIGVGVPVRVKPSVEVGARVLLDGHLGPFGLATAFDYYPGADAGAGRFTVAMFGQLSL